MEQLAALQLQLQAKDAHHQRRLAEMEAAHSTELSKIKISYEDRLSKLASSASGMSSDTALHEFYRKVGASSLKKGISRCHVEATGAERTGTD
jgi:hypothetical protein